MFPEKMRTLVAPLFEMPAQMCTLKGCFAHPFSLGCSHLQRKQSFACFSIWTRFVYELAVLRASLHPPKLLSQPFHFAVGEVNTKLFLKCFAMLWCCELIILFHFSINEVQYFWCDFFIRTARLRGHSQITAFPGTFSRNA